MSLIEKLQRRYGLSFLGEEKRLRHFARDWLFLTTPDTVGQQPLTEPKVPFASVGDIMSPGAAAMVGAKVTDALYTWRQVEHANGGKK